MAAIQLRRKGRCDRNIPLTPHAAGGRPRRARIQINSPAQRTMLGVSYLRLPPSKGNLPDDGVVVADSAAPLRRNIEHAGAIYQERLRLLYGTTPRRTAGSDEDENDADDKERDADDDDNEEQPSAEWHLKKLSAQHSDDLYDLLGLGHLRWRATEDGIRRAFRAMSLQHHPDKVRAESDDSADALEAAEERFKKIRSAYELLSDRRKRAAYDSIDDVDDSIPKERDVTEDNFFELFGEAFDLNSRWSTASRVPKLGDDSTPLGDVDHFYAFWSNFRSWREFTLDAEYNPEQAEYREERRWMERQNAKAAKAKKLAEAARIRTLVETAYRLDPRIIRRREAEREAKQRQKDEKRKAREDAERTAREEEERQRREREQRELEEKEARAEERREHDRQRKELRRSRARLRAIASAGARDAAVAAATNGSGATRTAQVDAFDALIEKLCGGLSRESIDALEGELQSVVGDSEKLERLQRAGRDLQTQQEAQMRQKERLEEQKRASIAAVDGRTSTTAAAATSLASWSAEEKSALAKAVAKFPGGTRDRWVKVAGVVGTRDADECLAAVNETRAAAQRRQATPTTGAADGKASAPASRAVAPAADGPPNTYVFSKKQQTSLEEAMKRFPPSIGADRWKKVAANVPGRTPEECEARFRELVSYYKSKKPSASSPSG